MCQPPCPPGWWCTRGNWAASRRNYPSPLRVWPTCRLTWGNSWTACYWQWRRSRPGHSSTSPCMLPTRRTRRLAKKMGSGFPLSVVKLFIGLDALDFDYFWISGTTTLRSGLKERGSCTTWTWLIRCLLSSNSASPSIWSILRLFSTFNVK